MRAIYRYEVPVDGLWHMFHLTGPVLHVAARAGKYPEIVEFWALHDSDGKPVAREFRVFGTGQPLPDVRLQHRGTVVGSLVWHLMERAS